MSVISAIRMIASPNFFTDFLLLNFHSKLKSFGIAQRSCGSEGITLLVEYGFPICGTMQVPYCYEDSTQSMLTMLCAFRMGLNKVSGIYVSVRLAMLQISLTEGAKLDIPAWGSLNDGRGT